MGYWVIVSACLPVMLISIFILSVLYFFRSSWFKGYAGEFLVHLFAKIKLDKNKYQVLRNVTLPTSDGTTQIDHIIVSNYGVFVVETKNMKGWIFGSTHARQWTQKIYKYTNKFQNPLHQNYKHVETLKSILGLNDQQIFSVVVFAGNNTFKTDLPENVTNGPGLIRYIRSKNQQVLFDADVRMILSKIEAERLVPSSETAKAHINHVKQIVEDKQNSDYSPKCIMTAAISSNDDELSQGIDTKPAFTDSWEERSWQIDEIQNKFTDRAFQ